MPLPLDYKILVEQASATGGTSAPVDTSSNALISATNGYQTTTVRLFGGASPSSLTWPLTPRSEAWVDVSIQALHNTTADNPVIRLAGATTDLFRITVFNASGHWRVSYWTGSWTQFGTVITSTPLSTASKITIRYKLHASTGEFIVKQNGAVVASLTNADTLRTADTQITKVTVSAPASNTNQTHVWGVIHDDVDTTNLYVDDQSSSGTMGINDTGVIWSSLDELPGVVTNGDFASFSADGHRLTINHNLYNAAIATWAVEGVKILSHCRAVSDPGFWLQSIARNSGGTVFNGPTVLRPTAGTWRMYEFNFPVNPETSVAWTNPAQVNTFQFGYHAKTTP